MRLSTVHGLIRRRILVNFRVDADVMQRELPPPFRPKLLGGAAVAGICLIRLEQMRPGFLALPLGLSSENAAHRVAVHWTDAGGWEREGVYIPRRDTDSRLNRLVGGWLFPGEHRPARFRIRERGRQIDFAMRSADHGVALRLRARLADRLPATSRFATLAEASTFFERGAIGYSATRDPGCLDGLCLSTRGWRVEPLEVESVYSSYFADPAHFPPGSVTFDCALLMRTLGCEWQALGRLALGAGARAPVQLSR